MRPLWSSVIHEYSGQKPVLEDSTSAISGFVYWEFFFCSIEILFFFNVSIIRMTDVSVLLWDCEEFYSWEFSPLFCLFLPFWNVILTTSVGLIWLVDLLCLQNYWKSEQIYVFTHVLVNTFIQIKTVLRHNFQDQDGQTQSKRGSGSRFMHAVVFWAFAEVFSLRLLLFCLHCCYLYGHLCYWLWETLDSNALT